LSYNSGTQTISIDLSAYATTAYVGSNFYPLSSNPAGYITSSALTGYATQSWVTSQGYLTSSALSPYLLSSVASTTYAPIAAKVPTGGTTGQVLTKVSGTNYDTTWTTPAASAVWGAITGTLSTQTDLQTALNAKLFLSGGALTGSITMAGATIDSEMSSDFFGVELSSDNTQYAELEYNQLTVSAPGGFTKVTPTGITFPDLSTQGTAGIPDAPSDGTPYVRFNTGWEQLIIT
jgi:hypothetical protein